MATTALLGATGMVVSWKILDSSMAIVTGAHRGKGSHILSNLISSSQIGSIEVLARRNPLSDSPPTKLTTLVDAETTKWAPYYKSLSPAPSIIFSALATTKAAAGGFENQYKLEHGLNIEMAKAAREAGTKIYVLISAANANTESMFPYSKMKGQIEEDIKALNFENTIILRPGLIAGRRNESRPAEAAVRKIADGLGMISSRHLKDGWAQDANVIAKAALTAALDASEGKAPSKVWVLTGREIIHKARAE